MTNQVKTHEVTHRYLVTAVIILATVCELCQPVEGSVSTMSFRQHGRGALAHTIYRRMLVDERHRNDDHARWYYVDTSWFPADLCDRFLQLDQDNETAGFLEKCYEKADWVFIQIGQSLAKSFLSWFMTPTSINGLLGRGSMFVFSTSQFLQLLDLPEGWRGDNLLDLGAGDGEVTVKMSIFFDNIYVTETSGPMVTRLKQKHFSILDIYEWDDGTRSYDVIACLNLLDRCDRPISMLHSMRKSLKPGGHVIMAVVLPFKPYVEFGSADNKPTENIILNGSSFEEQIVSLVRDVFEPAGFRVVKFTRVPYLSEGDMESSFYVLHDAVFVLTPRETT